MKNVSLKLLFVTLIRRASEDFSSSGVSALPSSEVLKTLEIKDLDILFLFLVLLSMLH